ncbi:A/B/D/E cyclin [Violaceomyces palustris]|uniref:A/B/D/E cyclin n=1 Tax=Violaceomyces palustris TaxID=1673888 RepID=A0ACD0NYV4_9BASI|nr:A/B/D/E cyclin [Violaceomyces palustris]
MEEERVNDDGRPVRPSRRVGTTSTASASAASRTTAGARRTAVTRSTVPTRAVKPVPELNEAQEIEVYEEPIQDKVEVRESKRIKTEVANRPAKDEGWIDLDAEDMDDPLMVAEYVNDIFDYMKELEIANMPNGNYMSMQRDINWQLRGVLIDWLIDIHAKFRLLPETLFLAVNIIDRFLSQRTITLGKLQLVGVTAMFVAAKYEEVLCPSIENFLYLANGGYTDEEILRAERYMLRILDFNLSYANPMNFLRRISKADNYDIQTRTVAKYFMEISLVDHRLMDHPPSLVAAASVWMARELLERGDWNPTLVHYSTYSEQELLGTAEIMVDYCLRPISHANFHKKYSSKKFMRASTYVVEWARNTFPYAVVSEEEAETQDWNSLRVDLFSQRGLERPDLSPLNSSRGVTPLTECKNDFGTDDEDEASFEDQAGVLRDVTNDLNDRHDSLKEEMY